MGHYVKIKKKFYISCVINFMHNLNNIVTIARIASDSGVKAGGAQSLQKKIMGYA